MILYFRDCTIIIYITATLLYHSPGRDPRFVCSGWRSEILLYLIFHGIQIGVSLSILFICILII